jgi:FMN phosphatase YigB (HAD superfamily)
VSRCANPCSSEQIKAIARKTKWGTGAPIAELHYELGQTFGYRSEWEVFAEDWCCHFAIDASMLSLVRSISAHNRVILFSNTNKVHWDFLVAASGGVLEGFEYFLSHEIGRAKPSIDSFDFVAKRAAIDPARSCFFDDLLENVEAARQAGFQAELFENERKLRSFLRERRVRPIG